MLGMTVFVLFLVALFAGVCLLILLKPDQYFTARRDITCPETKQPAHVDIDVWHRIRTFFRSTEELRLKSCSRWPERQDCREECLLQVDLKPVLLNRVLRDWCEGKMCPLCHRALTERDWRLGRFAALNDKDEFIFAAEMPLHDLPMELQHYRPVCWTCHSAQRARRAVTMLKGDRRMRVEELWTGE